MSYTFLSTFLIGFSVAYYLFSIVELHRMSNRSRLQQLLMYVLAFWALSTAKDLLLLVPGVDQETMLRHIYFFDGYGAATVAMLMTELTVPGSRISLGGVILSFPYLVFFLLHFFIRSLWLDLIYTYFYWVYALTVLCCGCRNAIRYTRYIRNNYSNIASIDISWIWQIVVVFVVMQLVWAGIANALNPFADSIYYLLAMYCWHIVKTRVNRLDTLKMPKEKDLLNEDDTLSLREYPFAGRLEEMVAQEQLYLNQDLSLKDLVSSLGTNRTYVSNYFREVLGTTFYDYINEQRILKAAIPMLDSCQPFTLEYIAGKSGFKSFSTFSRAFHKFAGCSPGTYRRRLEQQAAAVGSEKNHV